MADYQNKSGGMLILPLVDGVRAKVANGGAVSIDADTAKYPAVAEWIERDMLVKVASKTKKRTGLEKNADELGVEFGDNTTDQELIDLIKTAKAKE